MSLLDQALALAKRGFYVFPLKPGSKLPAIRKWPEKATTREDIINLWWDRNPDYNIGIATGPSKLLVVDVDVKNDKRGDETLLALELDGFDFPPTYTQHTPTGGRHVVYAVESPVRQGVDVLGRGLDIRSAGGFIVAAGSAIRDGLYTVNETDVAPAPAWLVERCGRPAVKAELPAAPLEVDAERARDRAVHYLTNEAPASIKGEGGDQTAYKVAAHVKDLGVDAPTCLQLMLEHWNHRCPPGWAPDKLWTKVQNAYRYGTEVPGAAAPEAQFQPVTVPDTRRGDAASQEPGLHPFEEINTEYAFVIAGNNHHVLWETHDADGRFTLKHLAEGTFHRKHAAKMLTLGDGKTKPLTELWMRDERRRSYDGLVFKPELPVGDEFYNLWRGFAYGPLPKGEKPSATATAAVDAWLEHGLNNICRGDRGLHQWLLAYFAHLIQKPWEKPLVSLVFRGGKGTGKNALVDCVGKMLGPHYLVTSNRRYLISNFNGHMENCILFVLDEATWAGDKQAEGILKDLITGNKHVIEHKGQEPYTVDNCTRVAIIGNEDWVVPASHDERRFAIFDVGDGRKQDRDFFRTMREGMEAGGYRLLLRVLLDFDAQGADINDAPATAALLDQKIHSLDRFEKWWFECLSEGRIVKCDFIQTWPETIEKEQFRAALTKFVRENMGRGTWLPDSRIIGHKLNKCCPSSDGSHKVKGAYVYELPTLEVARAEFDKFIGHKIAWGAR